jgi:DNA-binding NarL/FixJ family response regulator
MMDKNNILRLLLKENLSQPKVLLIEDCEFDAVFMKRTLNQYYPMTLIDHAETQSEALVFLGINTYDIILLDLGLPDTVGIEDVEIVKKLSNGAPVIVVSGLVNQERLLDAQKYGADGMICKADLVYNNFQSAMEEAIDNIIQLPKRTSIG